MLSKSLLLAVAATGLMAGAAFAQNSGAYPDKTLTPPDQVQNSPNSTAAIHSAPANDTTSAASNLSNQSNVSASVTNTDASGNSVTDQLITNGPVPDTSANRSQYGGPDSHAGKVTPPRGN